MTVMQALSVGGGLEHTRHRDAVSKSTGIQTNGKVETIGNQALTDLVKENDVIYVKESFF